MNHSYRPEHLPFPEVNSVEISMYIYFLLQLDVIEFKVSFKFIFILDLGNVKMAGCLLIVVSMYVLVFNVLNCLSFRNNNAQGKVHTFGR